MKVKKIVTLALCSALLLSTGVQVEAKDYYKKDFGFPAEGYEPYESIIYKKYLLKDILTEMEKMKNSNFV